MVAPRINSLGFINPGLTLIGYPQTFPTDIVQSLRMLAKTKHEPCSTSKMTKGYPHSIVIQFAIYRWYPKLALQYNIDPGR